MSNPTGYSLQSYGRMIANQPRMQAYYQALKHSIQQGDAVLDIGSGTGIFSMIAIQFGARHVYAIEPDVATQVAREMAIANGYADLISFIQDISTRVDLPEKVNVIVFDLRGVLPFFEMLIPTVIDARRRFLVPGGILIPSEEHLFAAVVEHPEAYSRFSSPWQDHPYDINMHAALKYTLNSGEKTKIVPEQLLAPALLWATLDYTTISNTNHQADFHFLIERDGIAHGLGNWFETALVPGVSLSNAPGEPELIYGQLFLPFTAPILVKVGDTLTVHLRADLVDGDYIWSWNTRHQRQGQPEMEGWDFEQSTLYSHPITLDKIKKKASRFIPTLSENGLVERTILDKMDGSHSLAEIAQFLTERFPSHFPTWQDALARAASVSSKYSR